MTRARLRVNYDLCPYSTHSDLTTHPASQLELLSNGQMVHNVTCEKVDSDTVKCDGVHYHIAELVDPEDSLFWIYLVVYIMLVLFAGTAHNLEP